MMKDSLNTRLRFSYRGKQYVVSVNSVTYTEKLIVNKLRIGHTRLWLILQNDVWRFVSDMPLCRELKHLLVRKVTTWLGVASATGPACIAEQLPIRKGILLNAVLNVLAVKKELP